MRFPYVLIVILLCATALSAFAAEPALQSPFMEMMTIRDARSARASSYDRSGGNIDWLVIKPGETKPLAEIKDPGCIKHMYWVVIIGDPAMRTALYRDVILRMYWDGEKTPSVECPFGDFFGALNGKSPNMESLAVVVNPGMGDSDSTRGMNFYLPMPFSRDARIEITNDSTRELGIYYHIDYETYPNKKPAGLDDLGRFHAQFRHTKNTFPDADKPYGKGRGNYTILEAKGQGNLAGYFLSVDNTFGGWWGEGDDMIFIDGEEWPPALHGTGSEEIFGGGACPHAAYSGPYTGFSYVENLYDDTFLGKNTMFRFFVNDPVRFTKSIKVTIEQYHDGRLKLSNDYSSVAYWYQREPHAAFPAYPSRADRQPVSEYPGFPGVKGAIEAEGRPITCSPGHHAFSQRQVGNWSRAVMLGLKPDAVGDYMTLKVPVETTGKYEVLLYLGKASDFGTFQLSVDGKPLGQTFDAYNGEGGYGDTHLVRAEAVSFGQVSLDQGERELRFEITGKNEKSTSYGLGVDCIVLRPLARE